MGLIYCVITISSSEMMTVCVAAVVKRALISVKVGVAESTETYPSAVRVTESVGVALAYA